MTAQPFRVDQPFPRPQNAAEFCLAYTTTQLQTNPADPELVRKAAQIMPWLQYLRAAAPFMTTNPILALAYGICAMDVGCRRGLIAALQRQDEVTIQAVQATSTGG